MKIIEWWMRRTNPEPSGYCPRCKSELSDCTRCQGRWREQACDCGIGYRCTQHDSKWF